MYALTLAIFIILISILFLPIKVEISLKDKKLLIRAVFMGITVYRYKKKDKTKENNAPEKKAADFEKNTVLLGTKIKHYANVFKSAVELIRKYVSIAEIKVKIDVGTGDAAATAICVGTLWGAIYGLLGTIGSVVYINKHNVQIDPVYTQPSFLVEGVCIIKSRIAYIIFIAITILMKIKSRKGKEE